MVAAAVLAAAEVEEVAVEILEEAAASAAMDAGSEERFSPVTAPDLRILAMSAALPVSGGAVDVGADPEPDDVADLDDADASAEGAVCFVVGAALSIVTVVRGSEI